MKNNIKKVITTLIVFTMLLGILPYSIKSIKAYIPMHTVTFEPNNGDDQFTEDVVEGGKATKPEEDPTKDNLTFNAWIDEEGNEFDFDNTTITDDITLTAQYKGNLNMVAFYLYRSETGKGGSIQTTGYYKDKSSAPDYEYEVIEGSEITVKAIPDEGNEFYGWGEGIEEYRNILSEDLEYKFTFTGNTSLTANFDNYKPDIIIHWSSMDGEDLMEPFILKNTPVETDFYDAFRFKGLSFYNPVFNKEGYASSGIRTPKPITKYNSYDEVESDQYDSDYLMEEEDMHMYELMFEVLKEVNIEAEAPKGGVKTETPGEDDTQTNPPVVKVSGEHVNLNRIDGGLAAYWVIDSDYDMSNFEGTFECGKEYDVFVRMIADFPYGFGEDTNYSTNGRIVGIDHYDGYKSVIKFKIPAEHNFGEWEVVKEATTKEEGLKKRTCICCGEEETEIIPIKEIYTLTFDLDGGTYNGKSTYTIELAEDTVIKLPKPTKPGYTFDYWEGSKYYAGQEYKVTGDHKFKAIWKKNSEPRRDIPDTSAK